MAERPSATLVATALRRAPRPRPIASEINGLGLNDNGMCSHWPVHPRMGRGAGDPPLPNRGRPVHKTRGGGPPAQPQPLTSPSSNVQATFEVSHIWITCDAKEGSWAQAEVDTKADVGEYAAVLCGGTAADGFTASD